MGAGALAAIVLAGTSACDDGAPEPVSIETTTEAPATTTVAGDAPAATDTAGIADPSPPRLTVVGTGRADAPADRVLLNLAVETRGETVGTALDEAEIEGRRMLDALSALAPPADQQQTSSLSVYPMFDMGAPPTYMATLNITARVTAEQAPEALDAAADAVGDTFRVYGLSWTVTDTDALLSEARADAFERARTIAEELAEAAGMQLGPIHEIRSGTIEGSIPWPMSEGDGSGLPFEPGLTTFHADVTVVWDLEAG